MNVSGLLRRQWQGYPRNHQARANLLLHIVLVPLFLAGNVAFLAGLVLQSWGVAFAGIIATLASIALQGHGHKGEPHAPEPFTGVGNALARVFLEQWITFPRFVLSGAWFRALRSAPRRSRFAAQLDSRDVRTARPIAPHWDEASIPDQRQRTVLVTGANSGLGYLTARALARRGARVIMTARDPQRGATALQTLIAGHPHADVSLLQLDLSDLDNVRAFADRLLQDGTKLDVLVNNAGIMMPPRSLTAQGHELQFGVNHLAHFALTGLLLPCLKASPDARVVTITSDLHRRGDIHFDDLSGERRYDRVKYYAHSKFANVLFALELARRLDARASPIRSVLAHPGYAATNLQLNGPSGALKLMLRIGNRFLAQPAGMGVLPQLYAATAEDVGNGEFFGPDGKNEMKGYPTRVRPVDRALDETLARRLWDYSEEVTGVRYDCNPSART